MMNTIGNSRRGSAFSAGSFDSVTVLERDVLPDSAVNRRGAPQEPPRPCPAGTR